MIGLTMGGQIRHRSGSGEFIRVCPRRHQCHRVITILSMVSRPRPPGQASRPVPGNVGDNNFLLSYILCFNNFRNLSFQELPPPGVISNQGTPMPSTAQSTQFDTLTPIQIQVLQSLVAGLSISAAARKAGVHRTPFELQLRATSGPVPSPISPAPSSPSASNAPTALWTNSATWPTSPSTLFDRSSATRTPPPRSASGPPSRSPNSSNRNASPSSSSRLSKESTRISAWPRSSHRNRPRLPPSDATPPALAAVR